MSQGLALPRFAAAIAGGLVVSCQAPAGHPLRDTATIRRIAEAAVLGGALAIRCGGAGGAADIAEVAAAVDVPVIGLTKAGSRGVFITPTLEAAIEVVEAGADVVAVDGTARPRPDGRTLGATVEAVHDTGRLLMADVSTLEEGLVAALLGADVIATTLAGYTTNSAVPHDPDIALVEALRGQLPHMVIVAEGRYNTPELAAIALAAGADAVVVGTAITDIAWTTRRFAGAMRLPRA
ncbi:MAG: N-acylglucosamine-6-phosphate 2-epimerase [Frankiales bacterium]|jgi:N-acylglucosamine-6-phosphate 2-epimerase|nr:N-acylglucosamine-6-phosphate 2-epimerase [Frankiales bacterium]